MIPAVSQVCSLHASFAEDIEEYAAGECRTIEVWLTKLEEYLKSHSQDDVPKLIEEQGVSLPVASFQGGLFADDAAARQATWEHFERRLALCRDTGIKTLVVAADLIGKPSTTLLESTRTSLGAAGELAAKNDVRLALEFQSTSAIVNNLETAAALVAECGSSSVGLCVDTFHLWTGPSRLSDLSYLTPENLFHMQVSDLVGMPRELAADADRILPGEGDLPLASIVEHLEHIKYDGCVSIELMNPQIWQVPPRQFGEIAMTSVRRLLGQAEMGVSSIARYEPSVRRAGPFDL
ncbi:MAG: sugar phosphate isomerase/epimerase [Pirellulales bacterium]|nr:sugar phosphate isomerase/epimerase [Pirellulales bacterium]